MSTSRLRAVDLDRPFHGVRSAVPVTSAFERAQALARTLPSGAFFSHATAAAIYGAPLPRQLEEGPVHVSACAGDRASKRQGVIWHETDQQPDVWYHRGLPVAPPPLAFCQLASLTMIGSLVAVGDFFVTREEPVGGSAAVCSIGDLVEAVDRWERRRGARRAREAVAYVRRGALSRPESSLRVGLVMAGLPEPEINHLVWHGVQRRNFMVDLAWPRFKIALEYEGDYHRTERDRFESDILRREYLAELGWQVIRVTAHDLGEGWNDFLRRVHVHIARASAAERF
ncbi:DUF559 domain-containing protein [Rathayibacter sp. YIM 133350]|uniref:endonuclease domain-containing protein n=1 Tax=Rathayibacter sp. YIM 133350 TaxID=3131992 RepID=UPI00307ED389